MGPTDNIQPDNLGNYSLNPLQFCKLLNTKQKPNAKLNIIIFPVINNKKSTPEIVKLSPTEASKELTHSLYRSGSEFLNTQIFTLNGEIKSLESKSRKDLCFKITSKVQSYKINLGVDSYKDLSLINTMLN